MTHKDIYTKFMIEYDKANVTSSYPSLTEYEVATVLDKAYHALIAQKVTGNNIRRIAFEQDLKAIEDISPLVKNVKVSDRSRINNETDIAPNVISIQLEDDHMYFINCYLRLDSREIPMDNVFTRIVPVQLMSHLIATKFYSTTYNMPWIKIPVGYIEDNKLYIVYDLLNSPDLENPELVYIKTPNKFVKDLTNLGNFLLDDEAANQIDYISYFDWGLKKPNDDNYNTDFNTDAYEKLTNKYSFECSDTMAEELISLAVAFALENVESQRLNSKLNMRGLEA